MAHPNHSPISAPAARCTEASGVSLAALFSAITNSVYQNRLEAWPPRCPVRDGGDAILNKMDDRNDLQEPNPTAGDTQPLLDTDVSNVIQITVPVGMLHCNCTIIGDPAS